MSEEETRFDTAGVGIETIFCRVLSKIPMKREPISVNDDVWLMTLLDPDNNAIDVGQIL